MVLRLTLARNSIPMQTLLNYSLRSLCTILVIVLNFNSASASHIIGGEIYWDCITEGANAGKLRFYLKLYRDCSQNTAVNSTQELIIDGHPIYSFIYLSLVSQSDVTPPGCGFSCASATQGSPALEEYVFASEPMILSGTPPQQGYQLTYNRCCRANCTNIQIAQNYTFKLSATMYPVNDQSFYPCYDSSPRSAEPPINVLCAGQEFRYNANIVDPNVDSLSYAFVNAAQDNGTVLYSSGYSGTAPFPGPDINPNYDEVTLDPVTGQIEYDFPLGLQGKWNTVTAVEAWRCGQIVSRNVFDMIWSVMPCSDPNTIPQISVPTWISPATAQGYAVTVRAGEVVNFTIEGADLDMNGSDPQIIEFVASSPQFGAYYTNADSGCANPPCATLAGSVSPTQGVGPLTTTFNWQTDCSHVLQGDMCNTPSSTYNFQFRYRDNFCPGQGTNFVNVAVTVLADSIMPSPNPRCLSVADDGAVTIAWEPVPENLVLESFSEYVILHQYTANGPYHEVGIVDSVDGGLFVHEMTTPGVSPSVTVANYYSVRTRSGCNGAVLSDDATTFASIRLSVQSLGTSAILSWTPLSQPGFPTSDVMYRIYRQISGGAWELIATFSGLSFTDDAMTEGGLVRYRIELSDSLPCVSVSNVAEASFNIGIGESMLDRQIAVSPNPTKGAFIVSTTPNIVVSNWEMIDLSGKVLLRTTRLATTDKFEVETGLLPGVYLLRLFTNSGVAVRRIVLL